jgi:hypothetical protein
MPTMKKPSADAKPAPIYLKGRVIETKAAQQPEPGYWLFESHGAQPLIGIGTEPQAATYARLLNHGRIDHMSLRPISAAEAEALAAALPIDAPPIFSIAKELPRVHVSEPRH